MGFNSSNAVISLLLLLQLGGALMFVLGGLYLLYCFNRAASGVERMADAAEAWIALQQYQVARAHETQTVAPPVAPQNMATPDSPPAPQAPAL